MGASGCAPVASLTGEAFGMWAPSPMASLVVKLRASGEIASAPVAGPNAPPWLHNFTYTFDVQRVLLPWLGEFILTVPAGPYVLLQSGWIYLCCSSNAPMPPWLSKPGGSIMTSCDVPGVRKSLGHFWQLLRTQQWGKSLLTTAQQGCRHPLTIRGADVVTTWPCSLT